MDKGFKRFKKVFRESLGILIFGVCFSLIFLIPNLQTGDWTFCFFPIAIFVVLFVQAMYIMVNWNNSTIY